MLWRPFVAIVDQHRRMIELWIHLTREREEGPSRSEVAAMFFAVTDEALPAGEDPQNAIELCETLSRWRGDPPLTDEERTTLNGLAVATSMAYGEGKTTIQRARWIRRLDGLGYLLGLASLFVAGFSWWILILMFGTWSGNGAARMAAKQRAREPETPMGFVFPMVVHVGSLAGLIILSVWRMVLI